MKKILLVMCLAVSMILLVNQGKAQLPAGSYAKNISMTDYLGTPYTLYSYTDAGKPVIMDVSATWCSPCWSYHTSGALETYYGAYGPSGDNSSMVFWIEGDESSLSCLQAAGGSCGNSGGASQGNWTSGTTFPMFLTVAPNTNQVDIDYSIAYFPTIYLICPNRSVTEVGQQTSAGLHTAALGCPAAGTNALDAAVWKAKKPSGSYCATSVTPEFTLQNYGTTALTSCSVVVKLDGTTQSTTPWTGSLAQYEIANVTIPAVNGIADGSHTMTFEITSPNGGTDQNTSNNIATNTFSIFSNGANVTIQTKTDNYPSENYWEVKDGSTVIATSEPFTATQTVYNTSVCLETDHCYTLWVYDTYGDGMSYGGVSGYVKAIFNGTTVATINGGSSWTTSTSANFCTTTGVEEIESLSSFNVYPNPFSNSTTVEFALTQPEKISIDVYNLLGEKVTSVAEATYGAGSHTATINADNLSQGVYYMTAIIGGQKLTQKLSVVK